MIMEKSKSFPDYSGSYVEARFGFEDRFDRCKSFSFNGNGPGENPEVKRRKRVASYNTYTVEGRPARSHASGLELKNCKQESPFRRRKQRINVFKRNLTVIKIGREKEKQEKKAFARY